MSLPVILALALGVELHVPPASWMPGIARQAAVAQRAAAAVAARRTASAPGSQGAAAEDLARLAAACQLLEESLDARPIDVRSVPCKELVEFLAQTPPSTLAPLTPRPAELEYRIPDAATRELCATVDRRYMQVRAHVEIAARRPECGKR